MNENNVSAQKAYLESLLKEYLKIQLSSKSRISKYETMMTRKSAKKWDASKHKKSLNRLVEANKEFNNATDIISQIQIRLNEFN